jgi:hypothetical protein
MKGMKAQERDEHLVIISPQGMRGEVCFPSLLGVSVLSVTILGIIMTFK